MRSHFVAVALAVFLSFGFCTATASSGPDGRVIAELKRAGSDLSRSHAIEFFLYVPTHEGADRVAKALYYQGFTAKVERSAKGNDWLVLATKTMVPVEADLAFLRKGFESLAASEKGQYDGWGAPVVK